MTRDDSIIPSADSVAGPNKYRDKYDDDSSKETYYSSFTLPLASDLDMSPAAIIPPPSGSSPLPSTQFDITGRSAFDCANEKSPESIFCNFCWMSILFSANHGTVMSCLSLATAQLGSLGAWQSGVLFFTYTASAVIGATYIIKVFGARDALIFGMSLYCVYVGCFWVATMYINTPWEVVAALMGAIIGGFGAGLLWTAQGVYFSQSAEEYAIAIVAHGTESVPTSPTATEGCQQDQEHGQYEEVEHMQLLQEPQQHLDPKHHPLVNVSNSNSMFAAVFAFIYLLEEVAIRSLSTFLLQITDWSWVEIYALYTVISVVATVLMFSVRNYRDTVKSGATEESCPKKNKVLAAWSLLRHDPKMKYMIGFNMAFGFASTFLNSYVNGQVIQVALHDTKSKYVGILSAWIPIVAAIMSLVFGKVSQWIGKGPVLIFGAVCFSLVVVPFLIIPNAEQWNWPLLLMVYGFQGAGRATFEGTLKAIFADFFPTEKEGAFANIILQNGIASSIGYVLPFTLLCFQYTPARYCIQYRDGTHHDILLFEFLVLASSVLGILGYWRASILHNSMAE